MCWADRRHALRARGRSYRPLAVTLSAVVTPFASRSRQAVSAGRLDPAVRGRWQLAPLVVDTSGCWGDTARHVLGQCAEQFPEDARPTKLHWWRGCLSAALERENSRLL